jgi:formylglycine-generating enzyme required for sulfatase activity
MKKLFLSILSLLISLLSCAQVYQVLWSNGQVLYTIPTADFDSVSYEFAEDIKSIILPSPNVVRTIYDTVYVHDTIYVSNAIRSRQTFTVNGVSFTMIGVEGGTFTMGATSEQVNDASSAEKPSHQVTLSDFYIGETVVTQELWKAVMGSNPSHYTGSQNPVDKVSWEDCQTFIRKLNQLTGHNFRLPTEAEWEYAARGGKKSRGYKYAGSNTIGDVAWYSDNSNDTTHPVKQKRANELGLYDMSGNVYEWCYDWYASYTSTAKTNPYGPSTGSEHILRGGSEHSNASSCRVSNRHKDTPNGIFTNVGFRIALSTEYNNYHSNYNNNHEYVDLGLSVKWATCNIGANSPEEYGNYYAWGEVSPKSSYSWSTYKWCNGSSSSITKYCTSSSDGTVDNKKQLEYSDDAAAINWGGHWRMPTQQEFTELREKCTWSWTTKNGVKGYVITGRNGNSIFLPAAGYKENSSLCSTGSIGDYWSKDLNNRVLRIESGLYESKNYYRYYGHTIRAVLP